MELEIKIMIFKFIISIITMLILSNGFEFNDIFLSPDERERQVEASTILEEMKYKHPILREQTLNSYEKIVASCIIEGDKSKTFENIGGHENIKKELLLHIVVPMRNAEVFFTSESLRPPTGVLLSGAPGTGKTLLATTVANECNIPCISITSSIVEQKYFGESEKIIKAIFTFAKKIQPCIIFLDEIDSLLRNRNEFEQSATYTVKTQFLQEIDKIENEKLKIILIAATNNPQSLDKALFRRLPRSYTVEKPDCESRKEIIKKITTHEHVNDETLNWISQETDGFSGCDIKDLFKAATMMRNEAFSRAVLDSGHVSCSPGPIRKTHWENALLKIRHTQRFS